FSGFSFPFLFLRLLSVCAVLSFFLFSPVLLLSLSILWIFFLSLFSLFLSFFLFFFLSFSLVFSLAFSLFVSFSLFFFFFSVAPSLSASQNQPLQDLVKDPC